MISGCVRIRSGKETIRVKNNNALTAPIPKGIKKEKCGFVMIPFRSSRRIDRNQLLSNDFMALINCGYIPRIKAMVPPLTPGTTSAEPTQNPFIINLKPDLNMVKRSIAMIRAA